MYQWYIIASFLSVEPTFLFPPENFIETVNETDSVTFVCVVVGIPAPNISFYRNGTLLDQSTDQRITLTDNSEPQDFQTATGTVFRVSRNLTLDNTTDDDSGTYICVASNAAANVTQDFDLVVQGEMVLQLLVRELLCQFLASSCCMPSLPQLFHKFLTPRTTSQLLSLKMPLSPAWPLADQDLPLCGPDSQTWPSYRTNQQLL